MIVTTFIKLGINYKTMTQENKINITELLKDCPKGMELDCTMFDKAFFEGITNDINFPIEIRIDDTYIIHLTKEGFWNNHVFAKCVIFPKGKITWEGFQRPFKDGDIVVGKNCACSYITIFKKFIDNTSFNNYVCLTSFGIFKVNNFSDNANLRLATEEEKQKLFDAIKDNGYRWNPETKTLEKLVELKFKVGDRIKYINGKNKDGVKEGIILSITDDTYDIAVTNDMGIFVPIAEQDDWELVPNKFDISALVPFESRVLVRDNNLQKWSPAMWGFYDFDSQDYPYKLVGGCARYCIPYEKNEHLLGTTNDCDNFFKTW